MSLSFRGFLSKYCKELTSSETTSIKKLFFLAESGHPRAYEPLLLLAISEDRENYLLKQAKGSTILPTYTKFLADWKRSKKPLEDYLGLLEPRNRFRRPMTAWLAEKTRRESDRKVLTQVAEALRTLLETKQMTRGEACRLTNVNKGNFYAFLKGDPTKLSRKTAMRIYREIERA